VGTPEREHWTVAYFRAISYERAGEWELAEPDFRTALQLEPDHPSVLNYLGYSLVDQGLKLDEAMKMVEKAVELRPNDGYIVDSLGWAHYKLGNYEEAVTHLERAISLSCGDHQCSSDPVINDHLGDAYWRVGREIEARFQWSHARDSDPGRRTWPRSSASWPRASAAGTVPSRSRRAPRIPTSRERTHRGDQRVRLREGQPGAARHRPAC
jgi:Flp pilus assembly protein TadD